MKNTQVLISEFQNQTYQDLLTNIYIDTAKIPYQTSRYIEALKAYENAFGNEQVEIYSAPGRSEIGGNHTDHQHGEVLAASINNDAIAIVKKLEEPVVKVISDGYDLITISLDNLDKKSDEEETTTSLIKGVLAGVKEHGYKIGGFQAYITSDVLIGAGLSSSAAFETIIGTILSGLYNDMGISAIEIAIIGQYAENVYFGKPCGLMDQMACSVGSLVHIDFADPSNPIVEKVEFDMDGHGYSLCITDTKGSHADLTADYAAVPVEMKKAAAVFGKEVLHDVSKVELIANLDKVRKEAGDRAALRAIHFVEENERVQKEVAALQSDDIPAFLATVKASGDSSFKYLQNVYTSHDVEHQNMSIALAVSDSILKDNGVSRVHGGGFAGTIQAFVKNSAVPEYKNAMDNVFGEGSCSVLKIRKYGGMKVL
ncbi:MAG: galactokinase [Lachnospiraceae bacterium]